MKKLLLILLIGISGFAQEENNFTAENKYLVWSKVFELKPSEDISLIKNNLKLIFRDNNFGFSKNQKCDCKGSSIYLKFPFTYNFKIETKENKYKVSVSNIIFSDNTAINMGGIISGPTTSTLEEYILKKSDGSIKTNNQNTKNLNCLNDYFTSNFTIQKSDW